jgi:hypothetical protein
VIFRVKRRNKKKPGNEETPCWKGAGGRVLECPRVTVAFVQDEKHTRGYWVVVVVVELPTISKMGTPFHFVRNSFKKFIGYATSEDHPGYPGSKE